MTSTSPSFHAPPFHPCDTVCATQQAQHHHHHHHHPTFLEGSGARPEMELNSHL